MCASPEVKDDTFITSYQRAHYYENLQKMNPIQSLEDKSKIRPDLYCYDPIINEKRSLYKQTYVKKNSNQIFVESYGKLFMTKKHTLKYLFDEYQSKPPKTLKNNDTTTGYHHQDPMESTETKLMQKFCTSCSPIKINNSYNEKQRHCEFINPYISITHFTHEDFNKSQLNGIAKNDIITCYNRSEKNKVPPPRTKDYEINRRANFKVPFGGDSSVYRENFKRPEETRDFMNNIWIHPTYFDSIKDYLPAECKVHSMEPNLIESKNTVQATC